MQCPSCGVENSQGLRFCTQCETPLGLRCERCGAQNPQDFTFCGQCRAPLKTLGKGGKSSEAERRHLTVMFCDRVDSGDPTEPLDLEEFRDVTREYQALCARVIHQFDGHVGQYQGDGLLVYFGYPQAHEDDAQRAVRAGLEILSQLPQLNARLQQSYKDMQNFPLQLRIGIHTGLAVVGEMGPEEHREVMALGEAPNIAARLQNLAAPNTVLVSDDTYGLTAGFFVCRELGPQHLKGVPSPVLVHQPLRESGARFIDLREAAGFTQVVGRKEELDLLLDRWKQVKEGEGWVALLTGEAGIGKSRLLRELRKGLGEERYEHLECHCSPYHQNSAFYAITHLVQQLAQIRMDEPPLVQLSRLEAALGRAGFSLPEAVPLFAPLLSLSMPGGYRPLTLTPVKQRQKILETLLAWLPQVARQQPVLFVIEDLQWIDPSTLELLNLFVDQGPTGRILTVLTSRPEFQPKWSTHSHLARLTLNRLSHQQTQLLVSKVVGNKTFPLEVLRQVVDKTDGMPLFVEELTKMVLESGLLKEQETHYELTRLPGALTIPATLHDSLLARLDRLGTAKETAQLGATLGREFPYELLRQVSPLDETALRGALTRLVDAELLYQRGVPPQARYLFKHALMQEAAYQSLLKSTRQHYHQRIAAVLTERFSEIGDTHPELLAHHCTEGGLRAEAVAYWQKAGQRAVERSAHIEAVSHFAKGLEVLKTLAETSEHLQQELTLQIALGASLMVTRGWAAPEVADAYSRAREICQRLGETPAIIPALVGLCGFYLLRADLQTAHELGEQILHLAQGVQDRTLLLLARYALGPPLFWLGEFSAAYDHLTQGIDLYNAQQDKFLALRDGIDPGVSCLSYAAITLWFLGYPDQALKRSREALTLAQELSHPHSIAVARGFTAWVHQCRRESQATQEQAEMLIALSAEQGFIYWSAAGALLRGWALALQGRTEEGIVVLHQGVRTGQAVVADLGQVWVLTLLAEVYAKAGHHEGGSGALDMALQVGSKTGERCYTAETYRLKGEIMLQSQSSQKPAADESRTSQGMETMTSPQHPTTNLQVAAEECFRQALDLAHHQGAKSLELRAAVSLGRLLKTQGKVQEARKLLTEIYGRFTEGFATVDLKDAQRLLEELA